MPYTPEDIQELIANDDFKRAITEAIQPAINGVASNLRKDFKGMQESLASLTSDPSGDTAETMPASSDQKQPLTLKALQAEIIQLRAEKEAESKAKFDSDRKAAIASMVSSRQLTKPDHVQKLFSVDYADKLKQEGNKWFVEDGDVAKPLDEFFEDYMSREGSYYLPPSPVNGAGSKESKTSMPSSSPAGADGALTYKLTAS